ncbi:MAG: hypothetical protein CVU27_09820 [Betaproteobacteria bacterium HGW-Betaproteobacteria-20]|nr:MAG: hypothetical protein CVU27_09820 [Betaproteobacteria bacterium HGW-Betaproteobacteria-20]
MHCIAFHRGYACYKKGLVKLNATNETAITLAVFYFGRSAIHCANAVVVNHGKMIVTLFAQ